MINNALHQLGIQQLNPGMSTGTNHWNGRGSLLASKSPVDGQVIGTVHLGSQDDYLQIIDTAHNAFLSWRTVPAPKRGEIIRQIGDRLRQHKDSLGKLVSYEMGKSLQEGWGEVQEMIDICDFAVGLSRQLYGLTMHSERPLHRMYEQYHPLGVVGIISSFNFPVAGWSWNAMACQHIVASVFAENNIPEGVSCLIVGDSVIGKAMAADERVSLVSATGSTAMGRSVAATVAQRLGKSLLELGGNNAIIITPEADLTLVIPAVVFGAVGTCGQRCTTTRRLIVHRSLYDDVKIALTNAYRQLKIGNPLLPENHIGPLIDLNAVHSFSAAIQQAKQEGGKLLAGGVNLIGDGYDSGCYVQPTIVEMTSQTNIVKEETFAPILYLIPYDSLAEAIAMQNAVPQGLSSAIFTRNLAEAEAFLSVNGSDCGIANVNIGTSGAEIGGAFGGEKATGGGRESGSDSWKCYMRRQTNTINYGTTIPLAQGIRFEF